MSNTRTETEAIQLVTKALQEEISQKDDSGKLADLAKEYFAAFRHVGDRWEDLLNGKPNDETHYEFQLFKRNNENKFLATFLVYILVDKDKSNKEVLFNWNPNLSELIDAKKEENKDGE
ncbi:MAG: hypothetical protein Q7Q71_15880 [Verrucomicrobiota bacterium JB023]|nr:hypothetical protein [Verrucomicrobiota bacterium JB023]